MKATKFIAAAITVTLTVGVNISAFAGVAPNKTTQENGVQKSEQTTVNKTQKNIRPSYEAPAQGVKCAKIPFC